MNVRRLPRRLYEFLTGGSSGPTMTVFVLELEMVDGGDAVRVVFELPNGERSTATLDMGSRGGDVRSFMQAADEDLLVDIVGSTVEVDLSELPAFYDACKEPPVALMASAANHPQAVAATSDSTEGQSMETLLFERFRALDGVSDAEARAMATEEALDMGDLDALNVPEQDDEEREVSRERA